MSSKGRSSYVAPNYFTSEGQILSKSSSRSSTSDEVSCTTHELLIPTHSVAISLTRHLEVCCGDVHPCQSQRRFGAGGDAEKIVSLLVQRLQEGAWGDKLHDLSSHQSHSLSTPAAETQLIKLGF